MSVPELIIVPSSACMANVVITIDRVVGRTESPFTLQSQSFKWEGEKWSMQLSMPPISNRIIAGEWRAFGVSLEGSYNYFLIGDPAAKNPNGNPIGLPVVNGSGQTGNVLQSSGWQPDTNNLLRAGDYIQIGSGLSARLYMVINNVNSNASGNANITISPSLRYSPPNASTIIVNEAKGLFRLSDNSFSWSVRPGRIYNFSFNAEEVL